MTRLGSSEVRAVFLQSELATILDAPIFMRSPVMSRLLRYLVQQAIADPDNPPKAYQVAVDGLGKDEDFDVQADSYPRVQIGRLRKMLAAYYAGLGIEQRISIPMGSYTVESETESLQAMDNGPSADVAGPQGNPQVWAGDNKGRSKIGFVQRLALGAAVILATLFVIPVLNSQFAANSEESVEFTKPPKLYIGTIRLHGGDGDNLTARRVRNNLVRSFQPFYTVRIPSRSAPADTTSAQQNAYRIDGKLIPREDGWNFEARLVSMSRKQLIWSRNIKLPKDPAELKKALEPSVSQIASSYGIIPNDQRVHSDVEKLLGYGCILQFDEYRRVRNPMKLASVEECIEASLQSEPLDPVLLSAAAFLEFIGNGRSPDSIDQKLGEDLAVKALIRGKRKAIANFGMARASFLTGNCDRGAEYAQKALDINPLNHDLLVDAGTYMFACGHPEAEQHLKRAIRLDPNGQGSQYTTMVFLKMEQGKFDEALEMAEAIVPPVGRVEPYYDLAMAMVYAHDGQRSKAREAWKRLEQSYSQQGAQTPEQILGMFITSKPVIKKRLSLLRSKKVV